MLGAHKEGLGNACPSLKAPWGGVNCKIQCPKSINLDLAKRVLIASITDAIHHMDNLTSRSEVFLPYGFWNTSVYSPQRHPPCSGPRLELSPSKQPHPRQTVHQAGQLEKHLQLSIPAIIASMQLDKYMHCIESTFTLLETHKVNDFLRFALTLPQQQSIDKSCTFTQSQKPQS
jgi:hypothetical protein